MTSVPPLLALFALLLALGAPEADAFQEAPATPPAAAPESIESLRAKAEAGDPAAQYELATRLRRGTGVEQDHPKALEWMKRSAEQGHVPAFAYIGLHLLEGLGTLEDETEAVKWFERGVARDDPNARYYLAICHQDGRGVEEDPEAAFHHYQAAALAGHASAQYEVALCLENGDGTTEDVVAARAAYEKAVAADHVGAKACLGNFLVHGVAGAADVARGMKLLKEADERGDGWAATLLGDFHLDGTYGLAKDRAQAEQCYLRAAERGETGATRLRRHFPGKHLERVDQCFDLSLEYVIGAPLLIEIERDATIRGRMKATGPRGATTQSMDTKEESRVRLVDEFLELGASWKASRTVVASRITTDGQPDDEELEGAELHFKHDADTDGTSAELQGGRKSRKALLDKMRQQAESAGVDVPLPRRVQLGERVRLDLSLVLPLLIDGDGEMEEAVGDVEFKRFDAEKLHAELVGRGTARERFEEPLDSAPDTKLEGVADYEYDVSVVVDLARRVVHSIGLKGHGTFSGAARSPDGKVAVDSKATVDYVVALATKSGPAATQARREKPKFRDLERKLGEVGVSTKLPSHFFEVPDEDKDETLFLSALGDERVVLVAMRSISIGNQAIEQAMKECEALVLKEVPAVTKAKDVRSGLGKGRAVAFTSEGEHFDVEFYPQGADRILRLRIAGSESAKRSLRSEIARVRESLKPLQ